jgi:hypothetical protein
MNQPTQKCPRRQDYRPCAKMPAVNQFNTNNAIRFHRECANDTQDPRDALVGE